jgi:hypothetical protein
VPLSDITFAEASGRATNGNGRRAAERTVRIAPSRKRAAAVASGGAAAQD